MSETHVPYYNYRDWDVTQNDQVFQQAIATARHLEVRRRRLAGANENILLLGARGHLPSGYIVITL